jgi:hypothetical protein
MSENKDDNTILSQLYTEGLLSNLKAHGAAAAQFAKNINYGYEKDGKRSGKIKNVQLAKFTSAINSLSQSLNSNVSTLISELTAIQEKMQKDSINKNLLANALQQATSMQSVFKQQLPRTPTKK